MKLSTSFLALALAVAAPAMARVHFDSNYIYKGTGTSLPPFISLSTPSQFPQSNIL
jgi:hypothetical protein